MIDNRPGDPSAGRRQYLPVVVVAAVCEGLALAASVAANLAAVWSDGPVAIVAAGLVPLILIGATYLFLFDRLQVAWRLPWPGTKRRDRRDGAPGWQAWWANLAAAVLILVPVASASYWHQRELLVAAATPHWIATLLPLAVDGLALRAALTLFRLAHQPAASAATDNASTTDADTGDDRPDAEPPVTEEELAQLPVVDGIAAEVVARAAELLADNPAIGRPSLARALGLDDSPARRLLRALRPIRPVTSTESGEAA